MTRRRVTLGASDSTSRLMQRTKAPIGIAQIRPEPTAGDSVSDRKAVAFSVVLLECASLLRRCSLKEGVGIWHVKAGAEIRCRFKLFKLFYHTKLSKRFDSRFHCKYTPKAWPTGTVSADHGCCAGYGGLSMAGDVFSSSAWFRLPGPSLKISAKKTKLHEKRCTAATQGILCASITSDEPSPQNVSTRTNLWAEETSQSLSPNLLDSVSYVNTSFVSTYG